MSEPTEQPPTSDRRESKSGSSLKISIKRRRAGEFLARNSMLTDLFQISHVQCVRNALAAAFMLLVARDTINDLLHDGRLNWTFELLRSTVGKLHIVVVVWCLMTLCTSYVVFYGTYVWLVNRPSAGSHLKMYNRIGLLIYVCYLTCLLAIPCWQIVYHQLPVVSSTIIIAEQLRQLMKTHSFVRENVGRMAPRSFSQFHQYVYFLFAPTLLYRDEYPRTTTVHWNIVRKMFGQFLLMLFFVYHLVANYWMPVFARCYVTEHFSLEFTMTAIFDLMLPGTFVVILVFYGFFHCWMNTFAEMLRFADRMFYEDWWNFTSAATFWRSWNVIVHDWLYVYVYKDLSTLFGGHRNASAACVVLLSALFHEYFMIVSLGFLSPILIGWFGIFGMMFRFAFPRAQGTQWNIFLLAFVPICAAIVPYLYALETAIRSRSGKTITLGDSIPAVSNQPASEL